MATIPELATAAAARSASASSPSALEAFADRWIFLFMASLFVAIVLAGFIPDSIEKMQAVAAGQRPPFPMILHVHSVLMGAFMLLLLAQTWLAATGRKGWHMQTGALAFALVPAIVIVGFMLVPVMYGELWSSWQSAPAEARAKAEALVLRRENILLAQLRMGILFPLLVAIALSARRRDSGLHKRMMILATVVVLPPAIARIDWLPTTMPHSYLSTDLSLLIAAAPMLIWDVVRTRKVHKAYWIWLAVCLPAVLALHALWDTPWWHATARAVLTS